MLQMVPVTAQRGRCDTGMLPSLEQWRFSGCLFRTRADECDEADDSLSRMQRKRSLHDVSTAMKEGCNEGQGDRQDRDTITDCPYLVNQVLPS